MTELFFNHEIIKLHVADTFLLNGLIYLILLLVSLATLRRKSSVFLDVSQTEQLKGLAIFFVVVEHFWFHVCDEKGTVLLLGDYAVTLFLLLSGYGLMTSNMVHRVNTREFFMKRVRKIFYPYWVVTVAIVVADSVFLQKQYPVQDILLTFVGINISQELQFFDHSRWFITLLLVHYLAFFFCAKFLKPPYATAALVLIALGLIVLRRYELFPLGARHQLLAFSAGCLLAVMRPMQWRFEGGVLNHAAILLLGIFAILSVYGGSMLYPEGYIEKPLIYVQSYLLPYLFCLLCIVSISLLASIGYISKFLIFCGYLSYEIYLIHAPFLIKYNFIIGHFENGSVLLGICLWFGIALVLAYALKVLTPIWGSWLLLTSRLK